MNPLPKLESVIQGRSLFQFIEKHSKTDEHTTLHRLCSIMRRMEAKSVVIEVLQPSIEIVKNECNAIDNFFGETIAKEIYRFTFIKDELGDISAISNIKDEEYLASVILINIETPVINGNSSVKEWRSYIFHSIIANPYCSEYKSTQSQRLYLHSNKKFNCEIIIANGTRETHPFQIRGTYFCQQNTFTSVCAHASLCMIINNMDSDEIELFEPTSSELLTPEVINHIIGIEHTSTKCEGGLYKEQIENVLQNYGLSIISEDFFENPNKEYDKFIYSYIESRCPVILGFTTTNNISHVVPVLGHTLNLDTWEPEAGLAYSYQNDNNRSSHYRSTLSWIDHFVIHDDNFGMYYCLPVQSLKKVTLPKVDPSFRANLALIVIPKKVNIYASEAEDASILIIRNILKLSERLNLSDTWSQRLVNSKRPLVVRTFLTTKKDYLISLNEKDFDENEYSKDEKDVLVDNLPDLFWLSEITLPDLYTANETKIIDFFYKCSVNPTDKDKLTMDDKWIQVRLPYILISNTFDPTPPISISPLSIKSHYPLFSKNTTITTEQ